MAHKRTERGDTLIEVLMAIVIISVVIVGAIVIMSRGLSAGQTALEHSQVRQSINGQVEMIRLMRDQYLINRTSTGGQQWQNIVTASNVQPVVYDSCAVTPAKSASAFFINKTTFQRQSYTGIAAPILAVPGQGMWVESVLSPGGISPAYVDFVVRACWQASGSAGEQKTVTAVRLYDPSR